MTWFGLQCMIVAFPGHINLYEHPNSKSLEKHDLQAIKQIYSIIDLEL